MQIDIV